MWNMLDWSCGRCQTGGKNVEYVRLGVKNVEFVILGVKKCGIWYQWCVIPISTPVNDKDLTINRVSVKGRDWCTKNN